MSINLPKAENDVENELHEVATLTLIDGSETTAEVTWLQMSEAFQKLATFASSVNRGCGRDWTCNYGGAHGAQSILDNLLLARKGIEWVTEEFTECIAQELQYHQEETGNYSRLQTLLTPMIGTGESKS